MHLLRLFEIQFVIREDSDDARSEDTDFFPWCYTRARDFNIEFQQNSF